MIFIIYLLIKISNGAKKKKSLSQKDLVGVSLFLSQSLKVILNCSTKSKEVVIHINYIYIPNATSRELIVGLLT